MKLRGIVELLQKDLVLLEKSSIASLNNENQVREGGWEGGREGGKEGGREGGRE